MRTYLLASGDRARYRFKRTPRLARFVLVIGALLMGGSEAGQQGNVTAEPAWAAKIGFEPGLVDQDGLYGPSDGRRALDYEFCIPDAQGYRDQVMSIEPTLRFSTSPGRIGCSEAQLLVIGNSHRPGFHSVLEQLARLPFVQRIERAWFE